MIISHSLQPIITHPTHKKKGKLRKIESKLSLFQSYQLIIMSILNEDSGSLVIAEGRNELEINSSDENVQREEDLFELSRDDPTLSFQIEEEKKQQMFIEILEPSQTSGLLSNLENQQRPDNKKKRKDIFEKFKKPQSSIVSKLDSIASEDNLLNIFDSIFKTKVTPSEQKTEREAKIDNNFLRPQTEIVAREKTPSSEKRERLKIFGKKRYSKEYQGILPSQLIESQIANVDEPRLVGSPIMAKLPSESINFSIIENRLSGIIGDGAMDISREELQIKNILQSQIFREEDENMVRKQARIQQSYSKVITSREKIQIQKQQAILHVIDSSPDKKEVILASLLPIAERRNPPNITNQIEESRVLRSDTSILSNSPFLVIQAYETGEGFRPENSMANMNSPNIADLTLRSKDNNLDNTNEKKPNNAFGNKLYQSQIIEFPSLKVVKANIFEHQVRMPKFLREIRKHISIYPNFYLINNPNTTDCIRDEFNVLFQLFTEAIKILSQLCQTVLDLKSKKVLYLSELSKTPTLQFFLQSGWEKFVKPENFQPVKPMQPFESREWSYEKAKTALKNYENIIQYYKSKGIKLDVNEDKGKKRYFEIRQKFWDICGNMKLISEDIYSEMIDCQFPQHFYVFLEFARQDFPNRIDEHAVRRLKELRQLFKILKNENDFLINSQIGVKIRQKLDLMSKYMIVY